MVKSFVDLNFDVLNAATINRYVDGNDIRLVDLGPIALMSFYNLSNISGNHLEDVGHAHILCLVCKLKTSARDPEDLSFGFHRSRYKRKHELTNNKNLKGKKSC